MSFENENRAGKTLKRIRETICFAAIFFAAFPLDLQSEDKDLADQKKQVMAKLCKLPMQFEINRGQTDSCVKYLSRAPGHTFFFTLRNIVMLFRDSADSKEAAGSVLKMQFIGANSNPVIRGLEERKNKCHYFKGSDPKKWQADIPLFAKVVYEDLYPGIDAVFYGNQGRLEYDLELAPGSNPSEIRLQIEGSKELFVDTEGNLCMLSGDGKKIHMQKPHIYQDIEGRQVSVDGQFSLLALNEVGFQIGMYDTSKPLVIDPVLAYSTYLGGTSFDQANSIAIDASGNAYVTGYTQSTDFPTTAGAFQTQSIGSQDAFIAKLDPTGSALMYSTYLGGTSSDSATSIAVDASGNAYVTGYAQSSDFPTTASAFQPVKAGFSNVFITKLNPAGSGLVYSTYMGGTSSDGATSIAVDASGNAYVAGTTSSTDFPITAGAFQTQLSGSQDAFITKLNPTGSGLMYSTYLGGTSSDSATSIAVDADGNAYVTGITSSSDFPITAGAFQTQLSGSQDAYITKFNPTGSALVYSTYLGGTSDDSPTSIAADASGNAYVTGTTSSTDFPTTAGAFKTQLSGSQDAFITKLNPTGAGLVYSTYLGGTSEDNATSIAVDASGNAYVAGTTSSTDFPTTADAFQTQLSGLMDAFITKLNPGGSGLVYSTYLGGDSEDNATSIAVDAGGNVYVTGYTRSTDFPTTPGAFDRTINGSTDAFIAKFSFLPSSPINIKGAQKKNCFLTQTEYMNIIKWQAPTEGNAPVAYKIYKDIALTQQIAFISSKDTLVYIEHNRKKGKAYTYYIVSVDQSGNSSLPVAVKIN